MKSNKLESERIRNANEKLTINILCGNNTGITEKRIKYYIFELQKNVKIFLAQ